MSVTETPAVVLEDEPAKFRKPKSYVLGNLGVIAAVMVIGACIGGVLVQFLLGFVALLVYVLICLVFFVPVLWRDKHDRSKLEKAGTRLSWWKTKARGENIYRSGPLTNFGTCLLPGMAANTEMTEWPDKAGHIFGLLHYKSSNTFAISFACQPDGSSLHDQFDLDTAIERWSKWLTKSAHEPGLLQVQVVVQTAPDSGSSLRREIDAHTAPNAPKLAKDTFEEIKATYPAGAASISTWVTLTFSGASRKGKRSAENMAKLLASRLPALLTSLNGTGTGSITLLDAQAWAQAIRVAYDPDTADVLAEAEAKGTPRSQMVTAWHNAGPIAHDTQWSYYRHDSGISVTWVETSVWGSVESGSLNPLLESHDDIPVKRVSLTMRPQSPDKSATIADKDKRNAKYRVKAASNPSSRAVRDVVSTHAVAVDEAEGHAVIDFALSWTATVREFQQVDDALAAVDSLAPTVRLGHRIVFGSQDTAFLGTLPIGFVPSEHAAVPTSIREGF